MLRDDARRPDLFPGKSTELRSKPGSKTVRVAIGPGVANIGIDNGSAPRSDGRVKVTVAHEKLPALEDVEPWKAYWSQWLGAIGD